MTRFSKHGISFSRRSRTGNKNIGHIPTPFFSFGSYNDTHSNSSRHCLVEEHIGTLALEAAKEATTRFHEEMSPSVHAEIAHHERDCVAPFKWDECVLGPLLGSGEFSNVFELKSFRLENHHTQSAPESGLDLSVEEMGQRLHMKNREKYNGTKKSRYALKHIKPEGLETHHGLSKYIQSARDLAIEKELLSSLVHPNIIKLRGVTTSGPTGFALIIDCLDETLDQKIKRWHNPSKSSTSKLMFGLSSKLKAQIKPGAKVEVNSNTLDHRLSIAIQIAAAMKYLQSHRILYRDLKPSNIGFDVRGDVKLFDFGLSRFCPEDGDPHMDAYKMSSAGTPRYLSPECLSGDAYNMQAEVYSFAIVLWEILSGKTPYIFARNRYQLINFVVKEHGRPDIDPKWPTAIQDMLKCCFDVEMRKRPKMEQVYGGIRQVLVSLRGGDCTELNDTWISRRRSVASMMDKSNHNF